MTRPIAITALLGVVLLAIYLGVSEDRFLGDAAEPATLTVAGYGETTTAPELAQIQAGVVTEARLASDAVSKNNEAMAGLFEALAKFDVKERDVQTVAFNVSPVYSRSEPRGTAPKLIAHRVENRLSLKVRDLDKFGAILDALVGSGANAVHSISFSVEDSKPLEDGARRLALEDARRKAEIHADTGDVRLGKILALQEGGVARPQPFAARGAIAAFEAVPIASGELTFRARIVVTYEIHD